MAMVIRRLRPTDVLEYRRVRLLALRESPTTFGSSYSEEARRPLSHLRKRLEEGSGSWVLGALEDRRLVGIIRLVRMEGRKERHKASIFGMYVAKSGRRKGIGRGLLKVAISRAKKMKGVRTVQLTAVTSNLAAMALYKGAGFVEYGREGEALFVANKFYSESLMARKL